MRLFIVSVMQNPTSPSLVPKKLSSILKRMKNKFSYFQFLRYGRFCTEIQKKKKCNVERLRPLTSLILYGFAPHAHRWGLRYRTLDYFVLKPPSQLVHGYHNLVFLNRVCV